jgi:HK97 gp10 family phage protein
MSQTIVFGLDEALDKIGNYPKTVRKAMHGVLVDTEIKLDKRAKRNLQPFYDGADPRNRWTGRLRASHGFVFKNQGMTLLYGPGVGTQEEIDYAIFVHEGTVKMPPRPWLRDAFNQTKPQYIKDMAKAIRGATD